MILIRKAQNGQKLAFEESISAKIRYIFDENICYKKEILRTRDFYMSIHVIEC